MKLVDKIRAKLESAFSPCAVTVIDESAKHAGHAGARPGGETHFYLEIVAPAFQGLSAVERQRQVYALLAQEMKDSIHALSLRLKTPEESAAS